MDSPLITEASSSGGAGAGAGYHKHKPYQRRSDAIAYGTRYQKAAALVDLVSFPTLASRSLLIVAMDSGCL